MEDSVFTKIIKREIPAEVLYEDDAVIAILDRFPLVEGQTLVIAKKQEPYLFALDEATYGRVMQTTKTMARVLDTTFSTLRTCVVIEGFMVPHAHVRVYPLTKEMTDFGGVGPMASDEELAAVAAKIRPHLT